MSLLFDDSVVGRCFWARRLAKDAAPLTPDAIEALLVFRPVRELVSLLSCATEPVRLRATGLLWTLWTKEAGPLAEERLLAGIGLLESGQHEEAIAAFSDLVVDFPDFAEGYNKRATALYLAGRYRESIRDCRSTLALNSWHFGAWHGLGLCLMGLRRKRLAIKAFEQALRIQPYARANRDLISKLKSTC